MAQDYLFDSTSYRCYHCATKTFEVRLQPLATPSELENRFYDLLAVTANTHGEASMSLVTGNSWAFDDAHCEARAVPRQLQAKYHHTRTTAISRVRHLSDLTL